MLSRLIAYCSLNYKICLKGASRSPRLHKRAGRYNIKRDSSPPDDHLPNFFLPMNTALQYALTALTVFATCLTAYVLFLMPIDLLEELTFYKKYHSNKTNKAIHLVCIPMIFLTFLVMSCYAEVPVPFAPDWVAPYLNVGTAMATVYSCYYCALDRTCGAPSIPILLAFVIGAKHLILTRFAENTLEVVKTMATIHLLSWVAQFIGHGAFEGNAPALFDSLFQSVVLAPFFVVMELGFDLGFRKDFERQLNNRVAKAISEKRKDK